MIEKKITTTINCGGILDFSTLDYLDKVSAVVYLCGCNLRCPWCQNRDLVLENEKVCKKIEIKKIVQELKKNYLVQAVCITGGEPLMQSNLIDLLKLIRRETPKLKIKLDTNACYPENLKLALKYLDFISVDIKAPLDEEIYCKVVGFSGVGRKFYLKNIERSLEILKNFPWKKKEARTTIIPGLNDYENAIKRIAKVVREYKFNYYTLQQFRPKNTLDKKFEDCPSPERKKILELGKVAKKFLQKTKVRIVTEEKGFEEIL